MNRSLHRLRDYEPPTPCTTSFSATFEMVTPISLAHPWICGDALIAERLMRELLGDDFYNLPTKAALPVHDNLRLPLKQTSGGVYHASASIFDSDRIFTTTTYKRFDSEHIGHVNRPRSKILRGQGFYKDAMLTTPYIPAKTVTFYFCGDPDECGRLLRTLRYLGKDRARGFGEIKGVRIEETPEDWSLVKDGQFMRPIPVATHREFGIPKNAMLLTWQNPYWDRSKAELCTAPGSPVACPPTVTADECFRAA